VCVCLPCAGPRIVRRNFDPGFFVEHFVKDMGIALSEAKRYGKWTRHLCVWVSVDVSHLHSRMGLSLPGLALAHQLYVAVMVCLVWMSSRMLLIVGVGRRKATVVWARTV
jgi:3-hydroxyisobutyrate dehydrogenase